MPEHFRLNLRITFNFCYFWSFGISRIISLVMKFAHIIGLSCITKVYSKRWFNDFHWQIKDVTVCTNLYCTKNLSWFSNGILGILNLILFLVTWEILITTKTVHKNILKQIIYFLYSHCKSCSCFDFQSAYPWGIYLIVWSLDVYALFRTLGCLDTGYWV